MTNSNSGNEQNGILKGRRKERGAGPENSEGRGAKRRGARRRRRLKREGKRGPKPKYPWREWLSTSGTHRLQRIRHFDCQCHSFAVMARNAATKYGARVSIKVLGDTGEVFLTVWEKAHGA